MTVPTFALYCVYNGEHCPWVNLGLFSIEQQGQAQTRNCLSPLHDGTSVCAGTEAGHSKAVLLKLLRPGGALADRKAVVVYTTFQVQAEQVAAHLHSHGVPAAAYHAGKHFKVCSNYAQKLKILPVFGKMCA